MRLILMETELVKEKFEDRFGSLMEPSAGPGDASKKIIVLEVHATYEKGFFFKKVEEVEGKIQIVLSRDAYNKFFITSGTFISGPFIVGSDAQKVHDEYRRQEIINKVYNFIEMYDSYEFSWKRPSEIKTRSVPVKPPPRPTTF